LDEPTIGLDLIAKQRFRELVVRVNEERGTTIFLTSHDVPDIEQVAKRAIEHQEILDDLPDRFHVADISVIDPPLEEIIAKIYEERRV
jgi:ABC-type uncharacterized transport system ATPase subunit